MPLSQLKVDYPVHTRVLDNGLRVVVSPDRSVPIVAVNLWYDVGSRDERAGESGWAHLFEHLMFQGSSQVASGEHMQLLQNVGGSVNGSTWFDRTNYYETVPTGALDLALWLEADRLATLADHLDATNLQTQRDVVKEEKRQRYDNVPYGHALQHLVELAFPPDHPYGHVTIGSMADLDAATPESAKAFFARHYRPDNAVLTLVGDVVAKDAFKRVEKAFGRIPSWNPVRRAAPQPLPPLAGGERRDVTAAVPADAVYLAWRLPARDTPRFDAADLVQAQQRQRQQGGDD
ncbi:MAG: pitrilysin family protein, partial [Propionicimonas sp.]|nr:pitrilysin family protein [Propionicimonas sp.]